MPAPAAGHPQFAMQALLARMGVARDEVVVLGTGAAGREALASEALRPAAATDIGASGFERAFAASYRGGARRRRRDRGRQCRGGGARDRGRAARGAGHARQDRGAGDARSRAGAPRRCGAWRAGTSRRTTRAAIHLATRGRRIRTAGCRGGARRARAGDAARAAQAPAAAAWAGPGAHDHATRRWSGRCCAGRARVRQRRPCARALASLRRSSTCCGEAKAPSCIATDPRAAAHRANSTAAATGRTTRRRACAARKRRSATATFAQLAAAASRRGRSAQRAMSGDEVAAFAGEDGARAC